MIRFPFKQTIPLTLKESKKAEINSICSACCTSMGDVPFVDAAIIILYANMLGASEMFSMITTSLSPMAIGLFSLLATMAVGKQKYQTSILQATMVSLFLFGMIVLAPFFGKWAVAVLLISLALFSICHTVYVAAWFPLLSSFLYPERRSNYFGRMRFSWQLSSSLLLLLIGLAIGKNPPIGHLQIVMLISLCIFAAKLYFIAMIPTFETREEVKEKFSFREGLKKAMANKPLTGFSVYSFILNLAAYGTIPMVSLYMKKGLCAPDNVIVLISSVALGGMLTGSFFSGGLIRRYGVKLILLAVHITYALANIALFLLGKGCMPDTWLYITIGAVLFAYSFMYACSDIASTCEMMLLATPGNKMVAMSFYNGFNYCGRGMSRMLTSLILGSGALAAHWTLGGIEFSHYQTLFLTYAICVCFAASLLVVVPAIFPEGDYHYDALHTGK